MSPKPARPQDADVLVPHRPRLGRSGAVVSPHGLASEAGLGVLRAGGNAVDAAIATNAALAVVAAHACGLGGDAFWLIWDGVELQGLNGSGRSGSAATLEAARTANGLTGVLLDAGPTIFAADAASGRTDVVVYPWDVSLAREVPDDSALNHLRDEIVSLTPLGNRARVWLKLLTAEVTTASIERLELRAGDPVVASFKATQARLLSSS